MMMLEIKSLKIHLQKSWWSTTYFKHSFNMLNMLRTTNNNPNKKTSTKKNSSQPSLHFHLLQPVSFQQKLWASQLQAARSTKEPVEPQAG